MRIVPILAALIAAVSMPADAHAQGARASLQVAATVVETPRVRLDATAATVAGIRGGARLAVPLAVSGAGSPSVSAASDGGEGSCQAVWSTPGSGVGEPPRPWLGCSVPRPATPGGVTEIRVTLMIVPAT